MYARTDRYLIFISWIWKFFRRSQKIFWATLDLGPYKQICVQIAQENFCIAGKTFAVKALRRMNGDLTFYNLFGSGVSCLRIKRLRDLEIEFLIYEILSTLCE